MLEFRRKEIARNIRIFFLMKRDKFEKPFRALPSFSPRPNYPRLLLLLPLGEASESKKGC